MHGHTAQAPSPSPLRGWARGLRGVTMRLGKGLRPVASPLGREASK